MDDNFFNNFEMNFPAGSAVSYDVPEFDEFIRSQGAVFVHFRSLKCPVGMIDKDDIRKPHDDHEGCSNGYIYLKSGTVTCLFNSNSNEMRQMDFGLLDGGTVNCSAPRFYDDPADTKVEVTPFDRFYLIDDAITVPQWELVEAHVTGRDRLRFPAVTVTDLIDSSGHRYVPGDYSIEKGQIVWKQGKGPGIDNKTNKGRIYSIRYYYRPYWYVLRLQHQIRIAQRETNEGRITVRMPQSFTLNREYVSMNEDKDDLAQNPNSIRQVKGPRQGFGFGPR